METLARNSRLKLQRRVFPAFRRFLAAVPTFFLAAAILPGLRNQTIIANRLLASPLLVYFCRKNSFKTIKQRSWNMFKSFIRPWRFSLGVLFLLSPSLGVAQSEGDSTFNGIDYYFGRIVRGFGGGFQQLVGDEQNGRRPFNTAPFLYGSIGSRIGLRLSNSTNWTELDNGGVGQFDFARNTSQFTSAQATYRPAAGIWLQANGAFRREEWDGAQIEKFKNNIYAYDGHGVYLSRGGDIELTPAQLAYAYYAVPFHASLRNAAELSPRFLSPGQTMLVLETNLQQNRFEVKLRGIAAEPYLGEESFSNDFLWANLDVVHALSRRFAIGFSARPLREEMRGNLVRPDDRSQQTANRTSFYLSPWLDLLASRQILHRFSGWYYFADGTNVSLLSPLLIQSETRRNSEVWQANYALQYLGKVEAPAREAFLADWNSVFGNRLPAKGLHVLGRAAFTSSQNGTTYPQIIGTSNLGPESKGRLYELSFAGLYGLWDWLEIGGRVDYSNNRDDLAASDFMPINSTRESSSRLHTIALSFANYRYESRRHRARFGWEQIREFDRLHGPLLLGGMINGTLMAQYQTSSFQQSGPPSFVDGKTQYWLGEAKFRAGITDKVELSMLGNLYKISSAPGSEQTETRFNVSFAWQPWESIRFRIGRGNPIQNVETGFFFEGNEAWNFQLMSLF
jgi:hypothetical protein